MANFVSNKQRTIFVTGSSTEKITKADTGKKSITKQHPNGVFFSNDTSELDPEIPSADIIKDGIVYTRVLGVGNGMVNKGDKSVVSIAGEAGATVYVGNNKKLKLKLSNNKGTSGYLLLQPETPFIEHKDGSDFVESEIKLYMLESTHENKTKSVELNVINDGTTLSDSPLSGLDGNMFTVGKSLENNVNKCTITLNVDVIKEANKANWNLDSKTTNLWGFKDLTLKPIHNSYVYCGAVLPTTNNVIKDKIEFADGTVKHLKTYDNIEDLLGKVFYVSYNDYIVLPKAWYEKLKVCMANYHSEYYGHVTNNDTDLLLNYTKETTSLTDSISTEYVVLRSTTMNGFNYITFKKLKSGEQHSTESNTTTPANTFDTGDTANGDVVIKKPLRPSLITVNPQSVKLQPGKSVVISYVITSYKGTVEDGNKDTIKCSTTDELLTTSIDLEHKTITLKVAPGIKPQTTSLIISDFDGNALIGIPVNIIGRSSEPHNDSSANSNSSTVNTPAPNTPAPAPNKVPKRILSISIEPVNLTAGTTKTVNYTVEYTGELEDTNTDNVEIMSGDNIDILVKKDSKTITLSADDDVETKTVNFDVMSNGTKVGTLQVNLKELIRVTNIVTTPDSILFLKSKNKFTQDVNVGVNLSKETTDSSYYDILTEVVSDDVDGRFNANSYILATVLNNGATQRQRTINVKVDNLYRSEAKNVNTVLRIKSKKDQSKLIEIPLKYYNTEQDDPDYVAPTPAVRGGGAIVTSGINVATNRNIEENSTTRRKYIESSSIFDIYNNNVTANIFNSRIPNKYPEGGNFVIIYLKPNKQYAIVKYPYENINNKYSKYIYLSNFNSTIVNNGDNVFINKYEHIITSNISKENPIVFTTGHDTNRPNREIQLKMLSELDGINIKDQIIVEEVVSQ